MNHRQEFEMLGHRQLALQEGIDLLHQARLDLGRARAGADRWAAIAVVANVTLIPLNIIVNGMELKGANTFYRHVVRLLYEKHAGSGTRVDGQLAAALSLLKQGLADELRRRALTDYVPGVNVLVGLAEDALAAWQVIEQVGAGSREAAALAADLERKIASAHLSLLGIGVRRAALLNRAQLFARTA